MLRAALLRGCAGFPPCPKMICRELASDGPLAASEIPYFMTEESNPCHHNQRHLGRLYKLPESLVALPKDVPQALCTSFFPTNFRERCAALGEHAIMIRKPALEIFDLARTTDWSKLERPIKFVLWGRKGNGKTLTLAHVRHFGMMGDTIVVDFQNLRRWVHRYLEVVESTFKPGRYDHIGNSQAFLKTFLERNDEKLKQVNLHQTYVWSAREKSQSGSPLIDVVRQGIERPKFAADCLNVVLKELKLHCQENNCRVVVLADGVNCIFDKKSLVRKDQPFFSRKFISKEVRALLLDMDDLSVIKQFKKMLGNDYKNALVVCSVDESHRIDTNPEWPTQYYWLRKDRNYRPSGISDYPFELLGEEGWETMDPFVPVEVLPFSDGELDIMIDYYVHKKYLRPVAASESGRQEIRFLTGGRPLDFQQFSPVW